MNKTGMMMGPMMMMGGQQWPMMGMGPYDDGPKPNADNDDGTDE